MWKLNRCSMCTKWHLVVGNSCDSYAVMTYIVSRATFFFNLLSMCGIKTEVARAPFVFVFWAYAVNWSEKLFNYLNNRKVTTRHFTPSGNAARFPRGNFFHAKRDVFYCLMSSRLELIRNVFYFHNTMSLRVNKTGLIHSQLLYRDLLFAITFFFLVSCGQAPFQPKDHKTKKAIEIINRSRDNSSKWSWILGVKYHTLTRLFYCANWIASFHARGSSCRRQKQSRASATFYRHFPNLLQ